MKASGSGGVIDVRETLTEITVSDLKKSREWYMHLFGKGPDLEPFEGNVEFKIGGHWVQIVKGKVLPSSWTILFEVRDLAHERSRLLEAGIHAPEIKSAPDVISWFDLKDPDGNSMRWYQVLTNDKKVVGDRN